MNGLAMRAYLQHQGSKVSTQQAVAAATPVASDEQSQTQLGADESTDSSSTTNTTDNSNVSPTPTTTTDTNSSATDMFLTMFVAEIQNQDPTNPTDPTEYISQLGTMALVTMGEAECVEMNTNAILMSNIQVMALGKMVGEDIMVQTTSLSVGEGDIQGRITLSDSCSTATLHFSDTAGDDYTVPLDVSSESNGQVSFDFNPADYGIPPGNYEVSVVTDTGEEEVPIEVSGQVEDVRIPLDGSTPLLKVTGVGEVPFTAISQFGIPDASANDGGDTPADDVI
ncbi:flagellar rod protein [Scandinavium sp. H11S7]|uniref:flagellar hook capping FlgD N-terminal domain-containing protein n=1 Tax=Scandinavium hiltneri TaxID=2926519 RepID=UPI002165D942|nr:flagellar hook capping FlgD N-terminal domain-containing protein [Scandinavium hiltneri]MCS2158066.1 flagellar rod protein [Scandinavium hiltneri]